MELYKENGQKAGLNEIMRWFISNYPDDIYVSNHPVHKFRDWAKEKLEVGKNENKNN